MKYLLLANPTVGHTNGLISIGKELVDKGNEVLFMLPGINNKYLKKVINRVELNIPDKLLKNCIKHKIIPISLIQGYYGLMLDFETGKEETLYALKVFSSGAKKYIKYINKELEKFRADAIIYDYTFFPAIAVSEKFDIPRIAIYHSGLPFYEYPIPEIGSNHTYNNFSIEIYEKGLAEMKVVENKIRLKYEKLIGKNIDASFITEPNSKYLNIITCIKDAEYPRKNLDDTVRFVGPCLLSMTEEDEITKNKRLIYISLGTVFNNRPELFKLMINVCKKFDSEIIVSAGKSYRTIKRKYSNHNIKIYERVSQLDVLKNADIFLTHGGKNSINESLKYGVPMILFPAGGEQEYNAKLIEYLKCGIFIDEIDETKISKAIGEIINNKEFSDNAKKISRKMENTDGAEEAVKIIHEKLNSLY